MGWYQTHTLIRSGFTLYNTCEILYTDLYLQPFDVISFIKMQGISVFLALYRKKAIKKKKKLKKQGYLWGKVRRIRWMSRKKNSLRLTR